MICKGLNKERRNMTISVTILGLGLATVMLAYLAFGDISDTSDASTIRLTAIIHRHGARTIGRSYPYDPHINYSWPGGFGFLTKAGSLQMFNLGKHLRNRYYRILPKDGSYLPTNMRVKSSATERCLMSTQSLLAGFLPPSENDNMLPIQWQPVAVTAIPRNLDDLIAQKKSCPKYDRLLEQMYSDNPSDDLKEIQKKFAETFAYLTKHTGKNMSNLDTVERLYVTLRIEQEHDLKLPAWTEAVYPEPLHTLAARNLAILTETQYMKRIKGGPIITQIFDDMVKKKSNTLEPNRSIFIYSGHDVTLVNIMRALEIITQTSTKPEYGATLAIELHHNAYLNDMEVKIVYFMNSEDKIPKEIEIPDCPAPCKLDQFEKAITHIIVRDYDGECNLDE